MTTFILTWNPLKTEWSFWDGVGDPPRDGAAGNWSTGGRKFGMAPGDRFFMLKQGPQPRGIVASGKLTSKGYPGEHWDTDRAGELANFVDIAFDTIVAEDEVLPVDELIEQVEGVNWTAIQSSGQQLPAPGDAQFEDLWAAHVGSEP